MLAIHITNQKVFMQQLLTQDSFDTFLLEEATLQTAITLQIDGHLNMDFYPEEERTKENHPYEFQPWSEARNTCFEMIKGKNTPLYFKFVLLLKPDSAARMLQKADPDRDFSQVKYLMLWVKYDTSGTTLTTGTSYNSFVMDKEADKVWDQAVLQFLHAKGIPFEQL